MALCDRLFIQMSLLRYNFQTKEIKVEDTEQDIFKIIVMCIF